MSTDLVQAVANKLAINNNELLKKIMPAMNLPSENSKQIFVMALERFEITENEINESFWLAYADSFVPSAGIEFRHLYKHIEVMRKGESKRTYTYEEMLTKMGKDYIPQEAFTMIEELDVKGRKKWAIK